MERQAGPPTVCVLTVYNRSFVDLAAVSVPLMREYASRQGYEFAAIQRDDCGRKGGWLKIEPIREALSGGFDLVLWLDADTLVIRKDVDIRGATRPGVDLQMVWHPIGHHHFNSGVMLIRSSDWARDFFTRVWETGPVPHGWNDQATILHLLGYDDVLSLGPRRADEPDMLHVTTLDAAWNSIVGFDLVDDPIIHHYAGIAEVATRLELMKADAMTIDQRATETLEFRRALSLRLSEQRRHSAPL